MGPIEPCSSLDRRTNLTSAERAGIDFTGGVRAAICSSPVAYSFQHRCDWHQAGFAGRKYERNLAFLWNY
jgi:hypothetical protein